VVASHEPLLVGIDQRDRGAGLRHELLERGAERADEVVRAVFVIVVHAHLERRLHAATRVDLDDERVPGGIEVVHDDVALGHDLGLGMDAHVWIWSVGTRSVESLPERERKREKERGRYEVKGTVPLFPKRPSLLSSL